MFGICSDTMLLPSLRDGCTSFAVDEGGLDRLETEPFSNSAEEELPITQLAGGVWYS